MTATIIEVPRLRVDLPDDLAWLEDDIRPLQRITARATSLKAAVLAPGATRRVNIDIPDDAIWAEGVSSEHFACHWADGKSCVLQLNLADVPSTVRKAEWPTHGVVWVFFHRGTEAQASVEFDPRPAAEIPWRRPAGQKGEGTAWTLEHRLPWCTPETLPAIGYWDALGKLYDDWLMEQYQPAAGQRGLALGGWGFTRQGDFIEDNKTYVCAIEDLEFGDCGEIYLFFEAGVGFSARAAES